MTIYTAKMPWGEVLRIKADLTQATAPILYAGEQVDDEENWVSTPYRTADARHHAHHAMMLVVEYLGPEWYKEPTYSKTNADIVADINDTLIVDRED